MLFMIRPCFLVIDREFPGSISTRKLVIETAKFNVLTAYSGKEALEVFARFPAVSGVVLDGGLDDISCDEVAKKIKLLQPMVPIVVIAAPGRSTISWLLDWMERGLVSSSVSEPIHELI